MQNLKLHVTGGDGFGWALDEDVRTLRAALPADVDLVGLTDAEVVYSAWWEGLIQLGTAALHGKRIVCGFDNPLFHWITRPRFRGIPDVVGLWVAHTREAMEQATELGLPSVILPYCLRTEIFKPLPPGDAGEAKAALRRKWHVPPLTYVIANMQRDTEGSDLRLPKLQKGPDVFAEIIRELHVAGCPIHVLVGGPRRHWLRAKLGSYGVPFTFVGKAAEGDDLKLNMLDREALNEMYQASDICVLTSRWEGGPYTTLEAAGTRTKVLSTRVGHSADILQPQCLFNNVAEAVEKLKADIRDRVLDATVEPQYRRVIEHHTVNAIAPQAAALVARMRAMEPFHGLPDNTSRLLPRASGSTIRVRLQKLAARALPRLGKTKALTVSIFRDYVKPPYGGGNQFMLALRTEMERQGVRVLNNQVGDAIDGYVFDSLWFNQNLLDKLARVNRRHVIHRIDGPIFLYRGKDKELDDRIFEINREFATTSVIQSVFTLRRIYETGYRPIAPVVVRNACDPSIFNLQGKAPYDPNRKVRLISTSWSDNPRKGGPVYAWLDKNLDFDRYEYLFLGRTSADLANIRQIDPVPSNPLADYLRSSDIYITASQNDPCSNALIEALSCGLPSVHLRSGGHPELVGMGGLGFDNVEEIPAILDTVSKHYATFQSCIKVQSMTEVAKLYLDCMSDT